MAPAGRALLAVAMAGLAWLAGPMVHASTFRYFADPSLFTAALIPGYYTATGSVLGPSTGDLEVTSRTFSGGIGPYGFTVGAASGNLYGIQDFGISTANPNVTLTFTAFTPTNQVRAFGGFFSLTDEINDRQNGEMTFVVNDDPDNLSTTFVIGATNVFWGIVSDDVNAPITSVTVSAMTSGLYATAEEITVGVPVAVPEPSTLAAAGMGALALGIVYRRRRWAGRGRAVAERET